MSLISRLNPGAEYKVQYVGTLLLSLSCTAEPWQFEPWCMQASGHR